MESEAFLSKANTEFALALFKKFSDDDSTKNIFYSSFSISAALAMVRLGAAGNTRTQISEVLRFLVPETSRPEEAAVQTVQQCSVQQCCTQSQEQTRMDIQTQIQQGRKPQDDKVNVDESFSQLLRELNKPDALYALNTANRLYGELTFTFKEFFLAETKKYYDAQLETVDFRSSPEASRININEWVEEQTKGKITDLLPKDSVNSLTTLVLVNAIYFKGKWESQFGESGTADGEFRLNKNTTKTVKMMQQKSDFRYRFVEEVNCKILEMPYQGKDLSMIIMLPKDIEDDTTGLEKLESGLTADKFEEWTDKDSMGTSEVEVSLPKFKLEQSFDLKKVLTEMGMVDAFDVSKSDLSGISDTSDLTISAVVHKAFVEVNEEGTEAAAATGVVIGVTAIFNPGFSFIADHPFLFFIKHLPSNTVLFTGRVCSPE